MWLIYAILIFICVQGLIQAIEIRRLEKNQRKMEADLAIAHDKITRLKNVYYDHVSRLIEERKRGTDGR